jgi:RNA recognition motif-containing protein
MPLFVGDLASVCTEADLMKAFSRFGAVLEVKLMRDNRTKQSLLYGFVTFKASNQSEGAMAGLDGQLLFGRRMK